MRLDAAAYAKVIAEQAARIAADDALESGSLTKVPKTDRSSVARVGEQTPIVVRLGSMAGPVYRPIFEAPYPCRVKKISLIPSSAVPDATARWAMVFRRPERNYMARRAYDAVIARSPLRFWTFDDIGDPTIGAPDDVDETFILGPTTIFRDAMGSPDGLIAGAPTLQAQGPPVGFQTAITFDGTGTQFCRAPTADLGMGNVGAWSWWVKPAVAVTTDAAQMHVMGADAAGVGTARPASQPVLVIRPSVGGEPNGVSIWTPGGYVVQSNAWQGLRVGEWNLIEFVRSSAAANTDKLYVNGNEIIVHWPVNVEFVDESHHLVFGKSRTEEVPDYPFNGTIGWSVIYPTGRTLAEHQYDYGAVFARTTKDTPFAANTEWWSSLFALNADHAEMNIGDILWLEANPISTAPPIDDLAVCLMYEAL